MRLPTPIEVRKLKRWAELIYIDQKIKIRSNQSSHQEQIMIIMDLVKTARENPSAQLKEKILSVIPLSCDGDSTYVAYCRYLLHCIDILRNEGNKNE